MTDKVFNYECFGETLVFAEDLGWVDNHPDADDPNYDGPTADEIEQEAIEFIQSNLIWLLAGILDSATSSHAGIPPGWLVWAS